MTKVNAMTKPWRKGWEPMEPLGQFDTARQSYQVGGGEYGIMGSNLNGWHVVFTSDGVVVGERTYDHADKAAEAAERMGARA